MLSELIRVVVHTTNEELQEDNNSPLLLLRRPSIEDVCYLDVARPLLSQTALFFDLFVLKFSNYEGNQIL